MCYIIAKHAVLQALSQQKFRQAAIKSHQRFFMTTTNLHMNSPTITISISRQTLSVHTTPARHFSISTAKNGSGQRLGSECTPLGKHVICAKIGADLPINSVLVGRVPTGEIYDDDLAKRYPDRDWILTRILWLDGLELGVNKGITQDGTVCDSKARYIYIHGTPDTEPMGEPRSHGCIRMRNDDLVAVFELVDTNTIVEIIP